MKFMLALVAAFAVMTVALPTRSFAQSGMWHRYSRKYDPHTVETVSGEVMAVQKVAYGRRGYYGIHLLLKTAEGEIAVHLGPSWFVEREPVKIMPHDVIEVTGSRVTYAGKPALIAAEVKKGEQTLRLRTADGVPLWSRGRRR